MRRFIGPMATILAGAMTAAAAPALAQESTNHKIKTPVINNGGRPMDGSTPSSASHRLRPDALGEGVVEASATSASFRLAGGFLQAFPAPGEVDALVFNNSTTLAWAAETFAGTYNLYRAGPMGTGTGVAPAGSCLQSGVTGLTTIDPDVPPVGRAYFYFVNAVNCVHVEGPAGPSGMGTRCP